MDRQTDRQTDWTDEQMNTETRTDGQKSFIRTDFTYPGRRTDLLEGLDGDDVIEW